MYENLLILKKYRRATLERDLHGLMTRATCKLELNSAFNIVVVKDEESKRIVESMCHI